MDKVLNKAALEELFNKLADKTASQCSAVSLRECARHLSRSTRSLDAGPGYVETEFDL